MGAAVAIVQRGSADLGFFAVYMVLFWLFGRNLMKLAVMICCRRHHHGF
jgi:hypothetical protein